MFSGLCTFSPYCDLTDIVSYHLDYISTFINCTIIGLPCFISEINEIINEIKSNICNRYLTIEGEWVNIASTLQEVFMLSL